MSPSFTSGLLRSSQDGFVNIRTLIKHPVEVSDHTHDKRGVGKSVGNRGEASFEDLADDTGAAAKLLQARTGVAANQTERKRVGGVRAAAPRETVAAIAVETLFR